LILRRRKILSFLPITGETQRGFLYSLPLSGGESKRGFPLNQNGGFNGWKPHPSPLLRGEGEVFPLSGEFVFHFPPLSGEDKGGVSFILSPFQGENKRGGFRSGGVILIPSFQRFLLKNLVVLLIVAS